MNKDARIVFLTLAMLLMIGVVMIYSSSAVYAYQKFGDSMFFVKRHLMFLFLGVTAATFCMSIPVEKIRANTRWIFLISLGFLSIVLVPSIGGEFGGARRWLRFMGIGFQPSELAKFALVLYLADLISRKRYLMGTLKYGLLAPLFAVGLVSGLIFAEPDMGTSVATLFIGLSMLFVSGVRLKYLMVIVAAMVPAMFFAIIRAPYRFRRLLAFFDPWKDAKGAGFQLIQSFIALGSGGVLGVGLGGSKQKLFYLPESHTDFIFSIIGEELGFFGAACVLVLFGVFLWFLLRLSFKLKERFSSRAVFGVGLMISFEVIVNIGVSTGVLPTKGLPLPFISYGGSSLVCHLAAMGVVLNMSREAE